MAPSRVWLITGASSGFGLELSKLAASRGDLVIAGTRDPSRASNLADVANVTVVRLDHNEPLPQLRSAVEQIIAIHGTIDVVVNNAAYTQTGTIEETTPEETQRQFQANVFGPVNLYRAVLPHMRQRRAGTLITIGSMNAWCTLDACNAYNASKAAIRWYTLGLADEVARFGIRHCLVEPGVFGTSLLKQNSTHIAAPPDSARLPEYAEINTALDTTFSHFRTHPPGDVHKACRIMYETATSTGIASGRPLPRFLPLGSDSVAVIGQTAQATLDGIREWEDVSRMTDMSAGSA